MQLNRANRLLAAATLAAIGITLNSARAADLTWETFPGATLDLAYTGTDVVDKLIIGNTQMPPGAYGKLGSALPVIGVAQITGDGTLSVTSSPTSGFDAWIAGGFANGTVPIDRRGPDDDPDNDSTTISYTLTPPTPQRNFIRLQVTQN
jgi:hypothetical protein